MGLLDRLKKGRGRQASALNERLAQQGQGGFQKDDRVWKWSWDDNMVSSSKIRFLPTAMCDMAKDEKGEFPEGTVLTPCALILSHYFQGPSGNYYRENGLGTFGEDCPVRTHDSPLWKQWKENGKDEGVKKVLMNRMAKEEYIANILVIEDAQNPENNGKVFLFKFGRAVKNLLDAAANPKFATDPKIEDVFCAWEGATLNLDIVGEKRKFNNWEGIVPKEWGKCSWDQPSPLAGTEEEIEEIWGRTHSIMDFYDRKHFKSYDELEKRFKKAMGIPDDAPLVPQNVDNSVPMTPPAEKPKGAADLQKEEQAKQSTGGGNVADTPVGKPEEKAEDNGSDNSLDDFERMLAQAD
ncbi:single strand DNA binding protein [Vibrio phage K469]